MNPSIEQLSSFCPPFLSLCYNIAISKILMVCTLCCYRGLTGSINEGYEIQAEGYGVAISIG